MTLYFGNIPIEKWNELIAKRPNLPRSIIFAFCSSVCVCVHCSMACYAHACSVRKREVKKKTINIIIIMTAKLGGGRKVKKKKNQMCLAAFSTARRCALLHLTRLPNDQSIRSIFAFHSMYKVKICAHLIHTHTLWIWKCKLFRKRERERKHAKLSSASSEPWVNLLIFNCFLLQLNLSLQISFSNLFSTFSRWSEFFFFALATH